MPSKPRSGTKLRRWLRQQNHTSSNPKDDDESDDSESLSVADVRDMQWRTAVKTIEEGNADHLLDELSDVDDRQSVQDAVSERESVLNE